MTEPLNDEIAVDNEFSVANTWRPYDFLMFIEKELVLRNIDHQIMDLPKDLGAISTCLKYIKKLGRQPSSFVKYCLWLFDGLDMKSVTSLEFMPGSLRHFYGASPKTAKVQKVIDKDLPKMSTAAKVWLEDLRRTYG